MSSSTSATIGTYYNSIQFRDGPASTIASYAALVGSGAMTLEQVRTAIIDDPYTTNNVDPVVRLYQAAFGRVPEAASSIDFYADRLADGRLNLITIAQNFAASPEFQARYGADAAPNAATVTALYLNVLGRAPSSAEVNWYLSSGMTTAQMLQGFSQSPEFQARSNAAVESLLNANALGTAVFSGPLQIVTPGQTFTLTTGVDERTGTSGNDTFDGSLNSSGRATLNAQDELNGGAGRDLLVATISGNITPAALTSIEDVEVTFSDAVTLNLANADAVETVTLRGNTHAAAVSNIRNTNVDLAVVDTGSAATFTYATGATAGSADTVDLAVQGVTGGAAINVAGVEVFNIAARTTASSIDLEAAAATTLNVSGNAALTIAALATGANTVNVSSVDASTHSGGLTIELGAQTGVATGRVITVTGGSGNDTITMTGVTQTYSVNGGVGNDVIVDTGVAAGSTGDTINGGDGTDTLATNVAQVDNLTSAAAFTRITNMEVLRLLDAAAGETFTLEHVGAGINTLELAHNGTGTVVGREGAALTVNIGTNTAGSTAALAAGTFTVQDTGTGTSDTATIANRSDATNAFAARNLVSTGYETLVINTTGRGAATAQTIGTIAVTGDTGGTAAETVRFTGSNAITTLGAITADIVDASGLTAAGTGFTFDMADTGNTATTITGSEGNDDLRGHATSANSIVGGAGIDSIAGGSGNDRLFGGDGNDAITAGAGNDFIEGGAGNDTFTLASNLTVNDTLNGGDGTDVLSIEAAVSAVMTGVTNMETLRTNGITQDLSFFTGTTLTRVEQTTGTGSYSNVGSAVTTFNARADLTAATLTRASDTSTNELSVDITGEAAAGDAATVTTLTVADEETINLRGLANTDGSLLGVAIGTLSASDLTTLNVSGAQAVAITTLTAASLDAINISATADVALGTLSTNALSTVSITGSGAVSFTASSNIDAVTLTTTGSGAITATTGSGADILTGGAGADAFTAGAGNDSVNAGDGADTVHAGVGVDTLNGGAGTDTLNLSGWTIGTTTDGGSSAVAGLVVNMGTSALLASAINTNSGLNISSDLNGILAGGLGRIGTAATVSSRVSETSNFENVVGSSGTDYIVGSSAANTISGGDGADYIDGGAGNDNITGGAGADTMAGGAGVDTLVLNGSASSVQTTDVSNVITGFTVADDIIDFAANTAFLHGGAALTGYAEGALANIAATTGFQVFSNNITVADAAIGVTEAELETYLTTTEIFHTAGANGAVYIAVDNGTDTWILSVQSSGANKVFTAVEDDSVVVVRLVGVADATTLSASNFLDFTA